MKRQKRYLVEFCQDHEWYFDDAETAIKEAKYLLLDAKKTDVKLKEITEVISDDYKVTRESETDVNFT